jgi:hypothetical protein
MYQSGWFSLLIIHAEMNRSISNDWS